MAVRWEERARGQSSGAAKGNSLLSAVCKRRNERTICVVSDIFFYILFFEICWRSRTRPFVYWFGIHEICTRMRAQVRFLMVSKNQYHHQAPTVAPVPALTECHTTLDDLYPSFDKKPWPLFSANVSRRIERTTPQFDGKNQTQFQYMQHIVYLLSNFFFLLIFFQLICISLIISN